MSAGAEAPAGRGTLRVLYLTDVAWPRVNGVSTSIAVFRRELAALGHDVPLVAPRYGDEPESADVVRVRGRRVPFDPEDRFVSARAFVRAASSLAFDVIHVHTPFAAHAAGRRLARARGVPLVETWHTDFEHYFEHYVPVLPAKPARAIARRLARVVGRAVDHLVVPSAEIAGVLDGYGLATPRTVVPTGLTPGELGAGDGSRFRARHGIPAGRPVAVHVGRVAHEKNLEFLFDAIARARRDVPDLLFVLAGEGPALPALERRAATLGLGANVLWIGYVDRRTELADVYTAGDVFAFASRTETQGLVLLEAMSLGVPVVAIAERGTRDLLAAGRGARVAPAEVEGYAATLVELLRDGPLRRRLGAEGRELAAAWSAEAFARRLAGLYRSLVAAREAAPAVAVDSLPATG